MLAELRSLLRHNTQSYAHRIAARDRNGYAIVAVDTIDWIEAADNYVELHCGPKTYLVRESMNNIEQQLDPSIFIRLHRSRIANASRIVAIAPLANGVFEVKLSNGTRIATGRQYRNGVLKLIGKAG
jgi:two-component system, LytTR family, response regulator